MRSAARAAVLGAALTTLAAAAPGSPAAILPVNVPPVTLPDAYVTTMGEPLEVSAHLGVLANDVDADGDPLKSRDNPSIVPKHGDLRLDNEGSFRYRPDEGYVGIDTFGYLADDGTVLVPGLVTITILPPATPTPKPTTAPTPTPAPTATPDATPAPTPTARPSVLPTSLPTLPPTPEPTRPPTPTPAPTATPTATPTPGPGGTEPPTVAPSDAPPPASVAPGPSGSPPPTTRPRPSPTPAGAAAVPGGPPSPPAWLTVPAAGPGAGEDDAGTPVQLSGTSLAFSGGAFGWAVPGVVIAVPGLLLLLAITLQVVAGAVWLPVVRRRLGGLGVRRRG